MTAYCFVWSPGLSNCTCILGALPLGTASDGATYSLAFCCECTITAATPINNDKQPICLTVSIDFLTLFQISPCGQTGLPVVLRAHQLGNLLALKVRLRRHRRTGSRTGALNGVCNLLPVRS